MIRLPGSAMVAERDQFATNGSIGHPSEPGQSASPSDGTGAAIRDKSRKGLCAGAHSYKWNIRRYPHAE
jgi:hypothetical protein